MNIVGQSGVSSKQGSNKDVVTSKDDKYVYLLYIIKVQLLINCARLQSVTCRFVIYYLQNTVKTITCSRVVPSFLAKAALKTSSQSK